MKKQYFINANIVDPHNSINEVGGLIISEDGKIEAIGKKVNTNNLSSREKIIDLKGKVLAFESDAENIGGANNTNRFDALNALVSLGFDKKAAEKTLNKIDSGASSVEELIKEALKLL